ncbi:MAG: hypothetical protein ABIK99_03940 [candidate division WOR-3 bacterium]
MVLLFLYLINFEITNWKVYPTYQYINQIEERNDTFYLATTGGLVLFSLEEEKVLQNYTYRDGLSSHYLQSFAWDRDDNLWLATLYRGVLIWDKRNFLRYPPERLPTSIRKVKIFGDTILLGSEMGVYLIETRGFFLQPDSHRLRNLIPGYIVHSLYADTFFWVGTGRGLFRISKDGLITKSYRLPIGDSIKGILSARDTLFVCGEDGIAYYDQSLDTFFPSFFFPFSLVVFDFRFSFERFYIASNRGTFIYDGTNFYSFYGDYTTALFISDFFLLGIRGGDASSGSLIKIEGERMKEIRFKTIAANCIFSVVEDTEGDIYLSHFFWGANHLTLISQDTISFLKDTLPVPDPLVIDKKNRLWVGHWSEWGGLSCYDKISRSWEIFRWGEQTPKNVVGALNIDQDGTKWFWNGIGNIVALDSSGRSYEFTVPGLGACLRGREIAFDSKKRVYLGTPNGLLQFDPKGTLSDPTDDSVKIFTEGLASTNILSVASDLKDRIWVATPQGLALLSGERFRIWNEANSGLVSNSCLRVRVDNGGWVWILTEGGLSLFHPEKDAWLSFTPNNSPILPNWKNTLEYYLSLTLSPNRAYVGTREGLIEITYREEEAAEERLLFSLHPNPLLLPHSSRLTIKIENSIPPDSIRVEIFNLRGKRLKPKKVETIRNGFLLEIDESFASGLYLLRLREEKKPYRIGVEKFVIIR